MCFPGLISKAGRFATRMTCQSKRFEFRFRNTKSDVVPVAIKKVKAKVFFACSN